LYLQMKEDENLETMPVIEQDGLESFHYLIRDYARDDYANIVSWWNPIKGELGSICSMWGAVKWIDQNGRSIKLVSDEDSQWIDLDKITEVKG